MGKRSIEGKDSTETFSCVGDNVKYASYINRKPEVQDKWVWIELNILHRIKSGLWAKQFIVHGLMCRQ